MKAVKIYQAGGPEQLIYQDVPMPDVKDGCFWCKQRDDFLHLKIVRTTLFSCRFFPS